MQLELSHTGLAALQHIQTEINAYLTRLTMGGDSHLIEEWAEPAYHIIGDLIEQAKCGGKM